MRAKVLSIAIEGNGFYLGMEKGCFVIRDKHGNSEKIPLFENEVGEITITSGNFISTSVLACCGFWNIPIIVKTRNGKPVAILRSLDDDSHVKTRIAQYEALQNGKGIEIAKTIVLSKIEGQNLVLRKHGLEEISLEEAEERIKIIEPKSLREARYRLNAIEAKASKQYFKQILSLMPFNVGERKGWKAYDGVNNTFNLAYTLLKFRVYSAILNAHLEPYLGFLHSEEHGKPSLVCDFMEIYRYLIDDYIIAFSQNLKPKDFTIKTEQYSPNRIGKREVLSREKTREFVKGLNKLFQTKINIPRIKHGSKQTIETLINEEAYLLAKHIRNEINTWKPRLPNP